VHIEDGNFKLKKFCRSIGVTKRVEKFSTKKCCADFQKLPISITTLKHPRLAKLCTSFYSTVYKLKQNLLVQQEHKNKTQTKTLSKK
jgi:hypothetical protein